MTTTTDTDAAAAVLYARLRTMDPADLRALREDRLRLTRLRVAHRLDCSDTVIRNWETGHAKPGPVLGLAYAALLVAHGVTP